MRKIALALLLAALAGQLTAEGAAPTGVPPYLSGGIGLEEQEIFKNRAGQFNLRLFFAEAASGAYLAGVHVAIDNKAGTRILDIDDAGPWFYATLPPGRYRITATFNGQAQARTVQVAAGRGATQKQI